MKWREQKCLSFLKQCSINNKIKIASSTRAGSLFSIRRTTFSAKIVHTWFGQSFVVQVNDQWKFSRRIILGWAARISDLKQIKVNDVNNAYLAMISYQSSILHFKQFKREPAFECGWTEKGDLKKTIWNLLSMYSLSNNHLLNSSSDFLVFSVEFSNFSIKSISDAFEHKQTHFWTVRRTPLAVIFLTMSKRDTFSVTKLIPCVYFRITMCQNPLHVANRKSIKIQIHKNR